MFCTAACSPTPGVVSAPCIGQVRQHPGDNELQFDDDLTSSFSRCLSGNSDPATSLHDFLSVSVSPLSMAIITRCPEEAAQSSPEDSGVKIPSRDFVHLNRNLAHGHPQMTNSIFKLQNMMYHR